MTANAFCLLFSTHIAEAWYDIVCMKYVEYVLLAIFVVLALFYIYQGSGIENLDKIYITITTFFFSIFMGFFISRQGSRYTKIREAISAFDGKLSSVYRASSNVGVDVQRQVGEVISYHYQAMIDSQAWDYHFVNKSNTITSIHSILETAIGSTKQESLRNQAIGRMLAGLSDCQVLRKNMVMLYQERIPRFQWFLIIFFVIMLVLAISAIPSVGLLLGSALKSAFVISILSVVIILYNLDNLHLFENFIGENSARDVIDIIAGNK
jgi:hypothetical protein